VSATPADTLHDVLDAARRELNAAGLADVYATVDVEVLARHVLGWDRAALLIARRSPAPEGLAQALAPLIARRAAREPVAYITGHREFWGLEFEVTSDVLVPRPETESVVEEALEILAGLPEAGRASLFVLDVGTGSGCLAVTIASATPHVSVTATDVSTRALRVAARNAARIAPGRVRFVAADLLAPFVSDAPFVDVLVSNPPYVPRGASNVMLDVERHEPSTALYGGDDGLVFLRRLAVSAALIVRQGGWWISEFGDGQEEDMRAIVTATGAWSILRVRDDLQGIARVIVARRT
jgi:release factor glutamine methyltransferase